MITNNRHRPYTPDDKNKLRDLYYKGYTNEEIANKLHRSTMSIKVMRSKMRLVDRRPGNEFVLEGVLSDYYPPFYVEILRERWESQLKK